MCDAGTAKCVECTPGKDAGCSQTFEYCHAAEAQICKKPSKITGVWRGIQVQKGFCREEWDFNFGADGSVQISTAGTDTAVANEKWSGTFNETGALSGGQGMSFEIVIKTAPGASTCMGAKADDKLEGMYKEADGYDSTFKFMYLATGKANGQIPTSFDASASDLVLLACKAKGDCDFTRV